MHRLWARGMAAVAGAWMLGAAAVAHAATPWHDDSVLNPNSEASVALRLNADVGALATLSHRLQVGQDGTFVSVPQDLGQNVLYPFLRFQADLDLGKKNRRNTLAFLYQPLDLRSTFSSDEDLVVGEVTYPAGQGMDFRYGFSFWRATWLYDVVNARETEIALGLGLQIRNASIEYRPRDGGTVVGLRNIGPVPLLAFRGRGTLTKKLWMSGEIQGFYAPIRYLNGGSVDVEGSIVDAALKLGLEGPKGADAYLGLRYVAGGAQGTSSDPDPYTDGFSRNGLHLMALSIGVALR